MGLRNVVSTRILFYLASVLVANADPIDKTLDSISFAETRGIPSLGDAGRSVSSYQIWLPTWNYINTIRAKSSLPTYAYSTQPLETVARAMARTYCETLSDQYHKLHGKRPSPEVLYLMYTMGWAGAKRINFSVRLAPTVKQNGVARFVKHYYGK
jgi:hypothetical protein